MGIDAKSNGRVLAAGAEKVVPKARELNANSKDERSGGREGPGPFRRFAVAVAALTVFSCGEPSERPDEDADAGDADVTAEVDADQDADVEQDSEADVEDESENGMDADVGDIAEEVEVLDDSGEAEASCPTVGTVSENPEAPGTIGGIEQTITETYENTVECDGSETRGGLLELRVALARAATPGELAAAVADGADTILFGETVRFLYIGLDAIEYAAHVPGASGTVRVMRPIGDGVYTAIVQQITESSALIRVERNEDSRLVDYYTMTPGMHITLPSGRILMLNSINFTSFDPLFSTCELAILEAPVRVADGERTEHLGHGYLFRIEAAGPNFLALDFVRDVM